MHLSFPFVCHKKWHSKLFSFSWILRVIANDLYYLVTFLLPSFCVYVTSILHLYNTVCFFLKNCQNEKLHRKRRWWWKKKQKQKLNKFSLPTKFYKLIIFFNKELRGEPQFWLFYSIQSIGCCVKKVFTRIFSSSCFVGRFCMLSVCCFGFNKIYSKTININEIWICSMTRIRAQHHLSNK